VETPRSLSRHFWQNAPVRKQQSRCPLKLVLGTSERFNQYKI